MALLPIGRSFFRNLVWQRTRASSSFRLVIYSDPPREYLRPGLKSMFVSRLSGEGLQLIGDEKLYPLLSEKEKEGVSLQREGRRTRKSRQRRLRRLWKRDEHGLRLQPGPLCPRTGKRPVERDPNSPGCPRRPAAHSLNCRTWSTTSER